MSHQHYVTIPSDELSRLQSNAEANRALGTNVLNQVTSTMRAVQQNTDIRLARVDSRIDALENSVSELPEYVRSVESNLTQQMRNQRAETQTAIQQTNRNIQDTRTELLTNLAETTRRLEQADEQTRRELRKQIQKTERRLTETIQEQGKQLRQAIATERAERQSQVKGLQVQISKIVTDKAGLGSEASAWIRAAEIKRDFIQSHYPISVEDRKKLERQEAAIQMANRNLSGNNPAEQAALSEAQTSWLGLAELLMDLEEKEREWHIMREQVIANAQCLLAEAQANRKLNKSQVGEDVPDEISEVDYWTNGQLSELVSKLEELIQKAGNDDAAKRLALEDLRNILLQQLPDADEKLGKIVDEAVQRITRSEIRANLIDLALQALDEQNYEFEGNEYEGDDMRNGIVAKAKGIDKTEVIISIVPDGENDRMEINYVEPAGESHSDAELMLRSREVQSAMQRRKLPVPISDVEHVSNVPDLSNRDLEEVKHRKKQEQRTRS